MYHVCRRPQRLGDCVRFSWTGVTGSCNHLCWCWELNPGCMQTQLILLKPRHLSNPQAIYKEWGFIWIMALESRLRSQEQCLIGICCESTRCILWPRASHGDTASEPAQASLPLIKLLMSSGITLFTPSSPNYSSRTSIPFTLKVWHLELSFWHMSSWWVQGRGVRVTHIQTMLLIKLL